MNEKIHDRDYYCSNKFRYLKIDMECGTTYNCHAAKSHPIDIKWLHENPGQLFNNPVSVSERQMMLDNIRNDSCEQNCWAAEDRGAISSRINQKGYIRSHTEIFTQPEILDTVVNSDCNLTCSYCCKEFSRSWRKDIYENGEYEIPGQTDERFRLSEKDKILFKLKQTDLKKYSKFQYLVSEAKSFMPNLQRLIITGGEPLLDNTVIDFIVEAAENTDAVIMIYTGLGLSFNRFVKIFEKLKHIKKLELMISAENTEKHAEFNRYGIVWSEFMQKIHHLDQIKVNYLFAMTMTNLTIHDFKNFYNLLGKEHSHLQFCYQPRYMAMYVVDDETKVRLRDAWQTLPSSISQRLIQSIAADPTDLERQGIREFLKQFVARRKDLSYSIFPNSFLRWLEL